MPPKRQSTPEAPVEDAVILTIDPELLEAALASVDKAIARRPEDAAVPEEGEDATAETVRTPSDSAGVDHARLEIRLREAIAHAAELERELLRITQLRDHAENQLRDLRKIAREAQNDFDRFRSRAKKEKDDAERDAEERLLRAVLDTADNLDRAVSHATSDPQTLVGGLQMIVDQFRGVLRRLGVERVGATAGTPFDPEIHEAVMHVTSEGVEAGAVVDEISPGYRLRGRLFRPARVTVASPA